MISEFAKRDSEQANTAMALKIATQNLVRQMRTIAPAPMAPQNPQQQPQQPQLQQQQQQQEQQQQQQPQQQQQQDPQQQQQQRPTKTLILKTIPLKMKQIAPADIKMPVRPNVQSVQQGLPQTFLPQQPTEVSSLRIFQKYN